MVVEDQAMPRQLFEAFISMSDKYNLVHSIKNADMAAQMKIEQSQIEANKLIKDAKAAIELEHKKMVADANNEISDIVTNAVEKIVSERNTIEAYDEFLNIIKRGNTDE